MCYDALWGCELNFFFVFVFQSIESSEIYLFDQAIDIIHCDLIDLLAQILTRKDQSDKGGIRSSISSKAI